jgi:hypothetical protein
MRLASQRRCSVTHFWLRSGCYLGHHCGGGVVLQETSDECRCFQDTPAPMPPQHEKQKCGAVRQARQKRGTLVRPRIRKQRETTHPATLVRTGELPRAINTILGTSGIRESNGVADFFFVMMRMRSAPRHAATHEPISPASNSRPSSDYHSSRSKACSTVTPAAQRSAQRHTLRA